MNSILRKLALSCVLSVLPVLQAAPVTVTFQGTITSKDIGSSTNAVVLNAVGQNFAYTLNYDDATLGNVLPGSNLYYGSAGAGWTASVKIGSYTFAPPSFTHEVQMQEQQLGPVSRDTIRMGSYNTSGVTWSSNGLDFINTSQLFALFLQDLNGTALPSRNLTDLDDITLASFTSAKTFWFLAFDPVIGANVELTGSITSFTVGPVSNVPEPSAFAALAGVGVLGIAAIRRRRRSNG